jgi:hypothetical protein
MNTPSFVRRIKAAVVPEFLRIDYSPYHCKVSSNKENYNLTGRIWHAKNLLKTAINLKRLPFPKPIQCQACLFDTRIPNIYLHADGLCNMCHTYRRKFDGVKLKTEVANFMAKKREDGAEYDAIVAYSGGKDSTVSLVLAVTRYRLKVMAVLVQNGFIPEAVVENGRRICAQLGVPLRVEKANFAPQFRQLLQTNFATGYPCYVCTELFHGVITRVGHENRINRVITGRNWWRSLDPEFSAVKVVRASGTQFDVHYLSLPFALQLRETDEPAFLEQVGWYKVQTIGGHSSNCLVPGLVEKIVHDRIGYHPELNLVSREVISGFLTKEEAQRKLSDVVDRTKELHELLTGDRGAGAPPA